MRISAASRLDGKRCRIAASCRRRSCYVQARRLHMRHRTRQVDPERDQCEPYSAMPDSIPRLPDWPPVWMPQEDGLAMTALARVMSQYLRGDPLWDGPRTVAAMRNMLSREDSSICPMPVRS